jgi:hypothetical protein
MPTCRARTVHLHHRLALVVLAAATATAACSANDSRADSGPRASDAGSAAVRSSEDAGTASEANGTARVVVQPQAKQVRTGAIALEASRDEVAGAADRVATIAEAAGGSVDEERSSGGRRPSADLVVRVPPERFRDVVAQIEEVAHVRSSDSQTRDVTGSYADLDGRIATMRISVARLQGFLARATDVNQIASLEGELTRRESDLESTQQQFDALSAQVRMATLRVGITSTPVVAPIPDRTPSPAGALAAGWDAFVAAARYLAVAVAASLPFLVVAALGWVVARRVRRPRGAGAVSG